MIVIFIKEHVAGFPNGAVKNLNETLAKRLIKEGYAEKSTEKELNNYNKNIAGIKRPDLIGEARDAANSSNGPCEDCEGKAEGEKCNDCGEVDDVVEKKYHILSQEDIDANEEAAEGLEVGDEVEISDDDELLIDEAGKLIQKDLGNV